MAFKVQEFNLFPGHQQIGIAADELQMITLDVTAFLKDADGQVDAKRRLMERKIL